MANNPKRLVNWKQWVLMPSAIAIGASLSLYREYRDTGNVRPSKIVIGAVALCIGFSVAAAVFWYADRSEKEHDE